MVVLPRGEEDCTQALESVTTMLLYTVHAVRNILKIRCESRLSLLVKSV